MPAKSSAPAKTSVTDELIREIAHKLWIDEGHPEGRAEDHWFKALEIAHAKKVVAAKKTAAKKADADKAAAVKADAEKKPAAKKTGSKKAA